MRLPITHLSFGGIVYRFRTSASHAGKPGSIPGAATNAKSVAPFLGKWSRATFLLQDIKESIRNRIIEIANSDDEDAINGIIPSVKAAATDRFSSLIDTISVVDTDDDATAAFDAVKSAYGKFSSLVGKSDGKKVDAALEKVSDDLSADGVSDTLGDDIDALKSAIGAAIEALDVSDSDASVKYAPAVIGMHVTDGYIPEKTLDNSAYVDAYRNGGGEQLEGHDSDKVTQQTKQEYSDVAADIINLVQTGIDGTPYIVTAILAATACIVIVRRERN